MPDDDSPQNEKQSGVSRREFLKISAITVSVPAVCANTRVEPGAVDIKAPYDARFEAVLATAPTTRPLKAAAAQTGAARRSGAGLQRQHQRAAPVSRRVVDVGARGKQRLALVGSDVSWSIVQPSSAAQVQRAIPGSKLVMMSGVGHLPYEEAPEGFNRVLLEFLRSN